ncbi:MAG: hypothetical protein HY691_00825 [Chloroflexi bacterium]|nr:hypothetical protein [Chloroflexota bacterium]
MRFFMTVTIPMEQGNAAIRDGSIGKKFEEILAAIKPEAVYFGPHQGNRALYLVVNIPDGSKIPSIAEPFFLTFNATIEMMPVFTPEELAQAAPDLEQAARKYH